jgi:hypothetical protein
LSTKLQLSPVGQELIDALKDVLGGAFVFLIDDAEKSIHLSMSRGWLSCPSKRTDVDGRGCHFEVAIDARWSIHVAARSAPSLHHSAKRLLTWTALKLAPHLPPRPAVDFLDPPPGGGGGPSGAAEVGIPVSWVRRTRNN